MGLELEWLKKARILLLTLYAFCLPLHQKWSTIVLLVLVAISLLLKKEIKIFGNPSFFLPPLLYLLIGFSLIYSDQLEFRYLEQRASLIAFPVVFWSVRLHQVEFAKVLKSFIWGCAIAVFICYGNAFYNSIIFMDGEMIFKPVVNEEFSFLYSVVRDGNYFFSSHFSIFHQSTYFAIYLNTAIAAILAFSLWKKHKINFFFLALFSVVIFQLSSKISLIICALIFMLYGVSRIKNKFYKIMFVSSIAFVAILLVVKNPRGKIMVETLLEKGLTIDPSERFGYSLRLMSWDAALNVISKNPIIGVGVGDVQSELNTVYEQRGYIQPLKEELNAHNQYLQIMLVCGFLGALVLIGLLWFIFKSAHCANHSEIRFFFVLFLIMITLSFMLESVLNRYSGISFFTFFYYLIITQEKRKSIDNGNQD